MCLIQYLKNNLIDNALNVPLWDTGTSVERVKAYLLSRLSKIVTFSDLPVSSNIFHHRSRTALLLIIHKWQMSAAFKTVH